MRTNQAFMAATLLALAPLTASAVEPNLKAGDRELEIAAGYSDSTTETPFGDIDVTVMSIDLRHGWFLTPQHEAGVAFSLTDIDAGGAQTNFGVAGAFYDFNATASGSVVPVVGVAAGFAFGDASGTVMEVSGGFRAFGSESVSVNTRAYYEIADDDGIETNTFGLRLGLSWIIR